MYFCVNQPLHFSVIFEYGEGVNFLPMFEIFLGIEIKIRVDLIHYFEKLS